jgi:hypothetical protein
MQLAEFISKQILKSKTLWILSNPIFKKIAFLLKNDSNKNVSKFFARIEANDNDVIVDSKPSNELFTNDMGYLKEEFGILTNNINYFYRPSKNV